MAADLEKVLSGKLALGRSLSVCSNLSEHNKVDRRQLCFLYLGNICVGLFILNDDGQGGSSVLICTKWLE